MHKRKAFALQKECNAAKSNAEEQAKAFKELKKENATGKEESSKLQSKLEATEAKLNRVKKALEREEKKNGKAEAGVGSELAKLTIDVERKQKTISDLKRRLDDREEQLRASEAKRKAMRKRESELIAKHKAASKAQAKEHDAAKRRFSQTEKAMLREHEQQKKEILRMQRASRVANIREERRSGPGKQNRNEWSGDKGQKNRLRKAGIKVGLSSSLTPVKINCGESSTSLESSFVTDVEENTVEHIDDSESWICPWMHQAYVVKAW